MNFQFTIFKLLALVRKPRLIIVAGNDQANISDAVFQIVSLHLKTKRAKKIPGVFSLLKNHVLILELNRDNRAELSSLIPILKKPVVITNQDLGIIKNLESQATLILNFDIQNLTTSTSCRVLTFGFNKGADFLASDVKINDGVNFKVNFNSSIVPFWLKKASTKDQIYTALAAIACAKALNINLVDASQSLMI